MDPLADKILVTSAFIGFLYLDVLSNIIEPWMVIVIVSRDILVTILRLYMKKNKLEMFTSRIAKLKTTTQLVSILFILACLSSLAIENNISKSIYENIFIIKYLMIIITIFTVYTGIDYYYRNIKLITINRDSHIDIK